jgi:hypothetical protein
MFAFGRARFTRSQPASRNSSQRPSVPERRGRLAHEDALPASSRNPENFRKKPGFAPSSTMWFVLTEASFQDNFQRELPFLRV